MRAADTEALMDDLDRFRTTRGTVEFFDALLEQDADAVLTQLKLTPKHPLAEPIGAWLRARGLAPPPPPTPAEILAAHGITDVEAWIEANKKRMADMEERLSNAVLARESAQRAASVYSGMTVILMGIAILGWLGAIDIIHIVGEAPLSVPDVDKKATGAEAAPEGRGK